MILYQDALNHRSFFGLYGAFEKNCSEFDLTPHANKIASVIQMKADGVGQTAYVGKPGYEFLDHFSTLECGKIYLIILKPGVSSIDIPLLKVSSFESDPLDFTDAHTHDHVHDEDDAEVREKDGYYYYSKQRMFKYKINQGFEYETSFHLNDFHEALDLWETIAWHSDSNYVHEIGIYFIDLVNEFGSNYEDVLAMASPEVFNKHKNDWEFGNTFPTYSQVLVNTRNISYMKNIKNQNGKTLYFSTLLHEIAHTLGLNYYSMNEFKNVPIQSYIDENDNKTKYYYYGDKALNQYRNYFPDHPNIVGIPLEDEVEAPRVAAHWEEGLGISRYINGVYHPALSTAMMTPFADEHSTPLTKMIIGFLEDYGYNVDYTKANPYNKN